MPQDTSEETWAVQMRALAPDEQADMLAGAVRLLKHPEAISAPLESEARVFMEQAYLALGKTLTV